MQISAQGRAFVAAHEGFVSKAYRCPAGVLTIGYGFTMRSKVFAAWWRAKHGRALAPGDTIARADADELLTTLINEEYGLTITNRIGPNVSQNQWDGSASVSFNCGVGALTWQWAKALARGAVKEAASRLRATAVTANGRRLPGLVRRRAEEARVIESGDYGRAATAPAASTRSQDVTWFQQRLARLGYDIVATGSHDGKSLAAVKKFQADNGLTVDGSVGPATRAAIIRALDAKLETKGTLGGAIAGGTTDVVTAAPAPDAGTLDSISSLGPWALGIALLVFIAFLIFRHRGLVTGRRVPT